jgi:hypothetical protein
MATLLFVVVFAMLFAPVLSGRATLVHGDALSVSLPLQQVLARSLARGELPLWSDLVYGGHPLFAEGQGGFAHPVNLLLFSVLPRLFDAQGALVGAGTLYAHGLLHVLCGLLAALGTYGLCRALGTGALAATFAGLALACSQGWLQLSTNSSIALTAAFAPLTLLAVERWWQRPDAFRALALGVATSAMLLAGYPQPVHAVAILAAIWLLVRSDRAFWRSPFRHLATGLLAVAVAAGLAAIQLLPTLELIGESVRAQGVALVQSAAPERLLRGQLFSVLQRGGVEPGLGSLLVLGLAGIGLRAARVPLGLALASLFLFQLAVADASPLHETLRAALPGLDRFRVTHPYATVAAIGVAVLAGLGVERVARFARGEPGSRALLLQAAGVALGLALLCVLLHGDDVRLASYGLVLGVGVLLALVVVRAGGRRGELAAAVLVAALVVEIAVLRLPLHRFADSALLREPPPTVVELLARRPAERGFAVLNEPPALSFLSFVPPSAPNLAWLVELFLSAVDQGSNLLWGIPSLNGNLALPLERRAAVSETIAAELRGQTGAVVGERFIDQIGLRYVVASERQRRQPVAADLVEIFRDDRLHYVLRENRAARERLQLVRAAQARFVSDFPAAARALREQEPAARVPRVLLLEGTEPAADPTGGAPRRDDAVRGRVQAEILSRASSAERHAARVEAREPVFLFLADAPYPGWVARLDGEPVPLLAADVLGKAVFVPPGVHEIEIAFEPGSFRAGLVISLVSLGLVSIWLLGSALRGPSRAMCRATAVVESAGGPRWRRGLQGSTNR